MIAVILASIGMALFMYYKPVLDFLPKGEWIIWYGPKKNRKYIII